MPNAFGDQSQNNEPTPNESNRTEQQSQNQEQESEVLKQLVGDGKKFSNVEALALGKLEADNFIEQLKREQAEMRAELDKRLKAEDALARIQNEHSKTSNENTTQVSEDDVTDLVKKAVQEMSNEEKARANVMRADAILADKYGEKRDEVVAKKAQELGVDISFLEQTAAQSPEAFLGMIGESQSNPGPANPAVNSSVNTDALSQVNSGPSEDTYAHFEKLRRENPKQYFSPEVQNKMMKLAHEKGADFYKS